MNGLWIERVAGGRGQVALRVAGQLVGSWVGVLERECVAALAEGGRPQLELSELTYVSSAGLRLLAEMRDRGLCMLGLTPLLSDMIADCGAGLTKCRDDPEISGGPSDPSA